MRAIPEFHQPVIRFFIVSNKTVTRFVYKVRRSNAVFRNRMHSRQGLL